MSPDDGSLNVMKDGYNYQLLNRVDQWILNQCRIKFEAVSEWAVILVDEIHGQLHVPSIVVLSLANQTEDLALKSTKIKLSKES